MYVDYASVLRKHEKNTTVLESTFDAKHVNNDVRFLKDMVDP